MEIPDSNTYIEDFWRRGGSIHERKRTWGILEIYNHQFFLVAQHTDR